MPKFAGNKGKEATEDIWQRLFYKGKVEPQDAFDYDEGVVRSAVSWLGTNPPEPFCLFMPLLYPHCPWAVEEPYFSMYSREEMPLPTRLEDKTGYEPKHMQMLRDAMGTHRATNEIWQEIKAVYYGMCTRMDVSISHSK